MDAKEQKKIECEEYDELVSRETLTRRETERALVLWFKYGERSQ